ncbi:DUF3006 domain-containing protein [Halobacillus seohaensis]|uniref:DUF3006 domain-containing protein n=1 Tax=Halobacillus seohaensis TaxID=447421 RepID=A0ABW2ES62_9BACI
MLKYTVDRIEGDIVVLLYRDNEGIKKDASIDLFPKNIKDGDIVEEVNEGNTISYRILKKETELQREKAKDLINKLKRRH